MNREQIVERLLQPDYVKTNFDLLAMEVFKYQYDRCEVYKTYVDSLGKQFTEIASVVDIPYLPISAFKHYQIKSFTEEPAVCFESSGTTTSTTSKHYIKDTLFYKKIARLTFNQFYGDLSHYCILGLLPSYLERQNSSLVMMVDHFIQTSKDPDSGFYLDDHKALIEVLKRKQEQNIPTLLIGVSFALLDLAEAYNLDLSSITFMETGGMKGRRKEIPRASLHKIISNSFNISKIHSEYGMTELLSQSYSKGDGIFNTGYAMRVIPYQITDPFCSERNNKTGVLNIIDLANLDSCAFIETQDLVRLNDDGSFEILGRLDESDLRGCNLMVES